MKNNIEPVISGDDRLVLICPKLPDEQTAEAFAAIIPKELEWGFSEGLSTMTMATIKVMLALFSVPMVAFKFVEGGKVVIMMPPLKGTATQPGSPMWDQVVGLLQRDAFTKTYEIRVGCTEENPNGEVYRDSNGYTKPDPVDGVPGENEVEEGEPVHQESPLLTAAKKGVKPPEIKDDRFDYDREFLPKDVGTDVKILLESCQSVEEFLQKI
jgi:hypothetical protein